MLIRPTFPFLGALLCAVAFTGCNASDSLAPPQMAPATPASSYAERPQHLVLESGLSIAMADGRIRVLIPEEEVVLTAAEALALGQASAFAGASVAVDGRIGFFPSWFPPDVCDPPGGGVMWGCSFSFEASQEMWENLRGEKGPPLMEGSGELEYNFGFVYHGFEKGELPFGGR